MAHDNVGWFVEVPRELKERFKALYPGRRQMKILTMAAIDYALRERPANLSYIPAKERDAN